MANPMHLKALGKGATRWNLMREQRPDLIPDLRYVDLSGALFVGLKPINFARADLTGADLNHATLAVIANGANLSGANLAGANLGTDFRGSNLSGAKLTEANLIGGDFSGADFTGADLMQADLANVNLSGSHLTGANLSNASLTGADLRLADLTQADLTGANLRDANLAGANLRMANLTWADFTGSDLSDANLTGANLLDARGFQVSSTERIKSLTGGEVDVPIERILCPVDFSEVSVKAYLYAQSIACRYHAQLILQHVVESPRCQSCDCQKLLFDAKIQLRHLVEKYGGIEPECVVEESAAADESVLSLARTRSVSLVVMGTNGWRGINHLLLGSVTESVLRHAPCPVLAIHGKNPDYANGSSPAVDSVQVRQILCCIDFSAHSQRALEHAFSVAKAYDADLCVLNIIENISAESPDLEEEMDAIRRKLQELVEPSTIDSTKIRLEVRQGEAYREILKVAAEIKSDMIITGVQRRNSLELTVFGSTTYRLIQLYPGHVLAVPI